MGGKTITDEHGITLLQVMVIAAVLIIVGYLIASFIGGGLRQNGPSEGISGSLARETGFTLDHTGPVTALSAVDGNYSGVPIQFSSQNATNLGAVQMTVALFVGDSGSIDFDQISLWWVTGNVAENLPRKTAQPLVCPGWMITGRYGGIPSAPAVTGLPPGNNSGGSTGQVTRTSAGIPSGADILQPGEQVGLLICPTNSTPPYQKFSVLVNPPGSAEPPVAIVTAPPMDHPVVVIGSE